MDQKNVLLALLRTPDVMVGTVQWMGQNIQYIAFSLYPAKRGLVKLSRAIEI